MITCFYEFDLTVQGDLRTKKAGTCTVEYLVSLVQDSFVPGMAHVEKAIPMTVQVEAFGHLFTQENYDDVRGDLKCQIDWQTKGLTPELLNLDPIDVNHEVSERWAA